MPVISLIGKATSLTERRPQASVHRVPLIMASASPPSAGMSFAIHNFNDAVYDEQNHQQQQQQQQQQPQTQPALPPPPVSSKSQRKFDHKVRTTLLPYLLPPTPVIHTRVPGSLFHPLLAPELKDHFMTVDEELMMKTLADMCK